MNSCFVVSDISGVMVGDFPIDPGTLLPIPVADYVDPFDAADVRNVEVLVRDNDTPGVFFQTHLTAWI